MLGASSGHAHMKSRRMGISTTITAAIIVIILLVGALSIWELQIPKQQQKPASLQINPSLPVSIAANSGGTITVQVTNQGGDANNVVVQVSSNGFAGGSSQFSLGANLSTSVSFTVSAKNVPTGRYYGVVQAQYTDVTGNEATPATQVSTYIIQPVTITNIGWASDFLHLLGKSTIGTTDSTSLHFNVQSGGPFSLSGLQVLVSINVTAPGMTFTPSTIAVGSLGPHGTSPQLSFSISTNNTPPGKYAIFLTVLSTDDFQIFVTNVWLGVTA